MLQMLQVYKRLLEKTKSIMGAKVEHNKFCLSVHFRCVDEKVCHLGLIIKLLIKLIKISQSKRKMT